MNIFESSDFSYFCWIFGVPRCTTMDRPIISHTFNLSLVSLKSARPLVDTSISPSSPNGWGRKITHQIKNISISWMNFKGFGLFFSIYLLCLRTESPKYVTTAEIINIIMFLTCTFIFFVWREVIQYYCEKCLLLRKYSL